MLESKLFAVFGNPIAHSKSPLLHNAAFRYMKLPHCYTRYLLLDGKHLRHTFFSLGLAGANITVPFKEFAFDAADERDDFAQQIGAVNTLIARNGKLVGYNTDAPGFIASLDGFVPKNALILGAGGAARAVAFGLKRIDCAVTIANRSPERLSFFSDNGFQTTTYKSLLSQSFDIVINTTSAGLIDKVLPCEEACMKDIFSQTTFAYDCIYGDTPFLQYAKTMGVRTKDGLDMLIWQAYYAYELFIHEEVDEKITLIMKEAARL